MKILTYVLLVIILTSQYTLAQDPQENDFKLIVPIITQENSSNDIRIKLDSIQKQLDAVADRVGVVKKSVTDPFAEGNRTNPIPRKPVIIPTLPGKYPSSVPSTDGGPAWKLDPVTGNYHRYVPAQLRPQSYYVPQAQPHYYYSSPIACPT